jgi:DNA-binding CsgD family transcriptional regulator
MARAARQTYAPDVDDNRRRRTRDDLVRLAHAGLDWVTFSTQATELLRSTIGFQRSCWHTVDPGTVMLTGSLNQRIGCSGSWLAQHEYVLDDVNQWWFLARSGRQAGAMSIATHGDLSRSARYRSQESAEVGDELRGAFVADRAYWGAAAFIRERGEPHFNEADVRYLASLSEPLAVAFRRSILSRTVTEPVETVGSEGPGVVIFDEHGEAELISPAAERWIADMVQSPAPAVPAECKPVQLIATLTRQSSSGDPLLTTPRSRVQTSSGTWLLLFGTRLSGGNGGRTAVIIQPATPNEVAPLVALAYGLSGRECQVTRLSLQGHSTKQMAATLGVSPYTVQDHLTAIFDKTGVRTRGELVGQVFLEHYAPQWEQLPETPPEWFLHAPRVESPA